MKLQTLRRRATQAQGALGVANAKVALAWTHLHAKYVQVVGIGSGPYHWNEGIDKDFVLRVLATLILDDALGEEIRHFSQCILNASAQLQEWYDAQRKASLEGFKVYQHVWRGMSEAMDTDKWWNEVGPTLSHKELGLLLGTKQHKQGSWWIDPDSDYAKACVAILNKRAAVELARRRAKAKTNFK